MRKIVCLFFLIPLGAFCAEAVPVTLTALPPHDWTDSVAKLWPVIFPVLILVFQFIHTKLSASAAVKTDAAIGVAHSIFNALAANGVIKNEHAVTAENQFWDQLHKSFADSQGKPPTSDQETQAHAEFMRLFTANTDLPVKQPPVLNGVEQQ